MRTVLAIAGIALRNAIRSRVVVVLLGLLLVAIVALPLTIKGDGTLGGKVQVLLRYTLGAVNIILTIATLWAGCAAISAEVQDRQVHLIVSKPVHRAQIWLGKWLGLLILNVVLLGMAGVVTYSLMRWNLRAENLTREERETLHEEILVARRVVRAPLPDVTTAARAVFDEQQRRGELPKGARPDQVLEAIAQTLLQQAFSVPPGMAVNFVFKLPKIPDSSRPLVLRYKYASSLTSKDPVACVWVAGAPERTDRWQRQELAAPGGVHTLHIPPALVEKDGRVVIMVANINLSPVTMVFAPQDGVELLVYADSFAANLARCLLVMLCELALFGALAVTLGCLFSLPVAALGALYAVLLMNIGNYLKTLMEEKSILNPMTPTVASELADRILHLIYVLLHWMALPFQTVNPLEPLATGELVGWWWVGTIALWQGLVATAVLAAIGTWVFNRRELGLPT